MAHHEGCRPGRAINRGGENRTRWGHHEENQTDVPRGLMRDLARRERVPEGLPYFQLSFLYIVCLHVVCASRKAPRTAYLVDDAVTVVP